MASSEYHLLRLGTFESFLVAQKRALSVRCNCFPGTGKVVTGTSGCRVESGRSVSDAEAAAGRGIAETATADDAAGGLQQHAFVSRETTGFVARWRLLFCSSGYVIGAGADGYSSVPKACPHLQRITESVLETPTSML